MTLPNAKVASRDNSVVPLPTQRGDSLESAINNFLLWEMRWSLREPPKASRDCIKVKRCYIDVAQDLEAGILLSQIIYWHLPDKEGEQKLTVQRDGYWWLAKAREDWWNECRLTPKQFDRAIRHLEKKHLVVTQVYKWHSINTKHIRVDWAGLLQALSLLDANAEKVVGFRRREPVSITAKPQRSKSVAQELGLPNSQSSGLPISQSKDSLLGNSRMDYQVSSELPNREFQYIDPEITSKTTSIDYSSPLTPQGELGEGTTQLYKSEFDRQTNQPTLEDLQPQQLGLLRQETKPTNTHALTSHMESYLSSGKQAVDCSWGKFSAAPVERENSCTQQPIQTVLSLETDVATKVASISNSQRGDALAERSSVRDAFGGSRSDHRFNRTEPQLAKNIDGSDRLPWETQYRGKFDPEFEKWMARSLMQYPAFQNLMAGELQIKVRKHISAGKYDLKRRDELFIEWEAMGSGVNVGDSGYGMTAKSISRRAKIRSALCS